MSTCNKSADWHRSALDWKREGGGVCVKIMYDLKRQLSVEGIWSPLRIRQKQKLFIWCVPPSKPCPLFLPVLMYDPWWWFVQGTLYTWEGYGTICADVNQLWNRLLVQWKQHFYSDKIVKPTVGWQLHLWYHSLPVYKEFPGLFNYF